MKHITVDASVIIKWIFPEKDNESEIYQALNLLHLIKEGKIKIYQPPHWLAEVATVVVRLQPTIVNETIDLLYALEFQIIDTPEIYNIACQLSDILNHHLFDTIYHAVPIFQGNAHLITADDKYYKKAHKKGSIIQLRDFNELM